MDQAELRIKDDTKVRIPGFRDGVSVRPSQVCAEVTRSAGGVYEGSADEPLMPGWSLHETGTCRMGNDPKHFVTNRFGEAHDVPNLYVCDASVFLNCTDKTTTISIMAFTLRTCEHMIEDFRQGEHKRA